MNLVDAQQARRVLDRLVGYNISPLLWAKVKRGLSAGRVQSVALRLIAEREAEIDAFIPQEYYTLDAKLLVSNEKNPVVVSFYGDKSGKKEISDKASLDEIVAKTKDGNFTVSSISKTERERKKPLPFTTSTLQQEAVKALNFSTQKTMRVAQQLYEGVDIKGQGTVGLITYLRTDSVRVSDEAKEVAANFIEENYGPEYLGEDSRGKKTEKKIQDAHEAIRPADITKVPTEIKDSLSRDQFRLYQLIWKRFVASQMKNAIFETTNVKVESNGYIFSGSASKQVFAGFRLIYTDADDAQEDKKNGIFGITKESTIKLDEFEEKQHYTQPPAHFTEASLVRVLEEKGIGRPSTYAPTIATILKRRYITKEGRNLYMTEIGEAVDKIMRESFPVVVNTEFTANMESLLDGVEDGKVEWKSIIRNFYPDLEELIKRAEKELEKIQIADEETDVVCENCGRHMVIKYGPHGKFLACPGFPECKNTKPYLEKIDVSCPKCGKEVVIRKTKKGRKFFGCEDYPDCDFVSWQRPVAKKCPKCNNYMVIRGKKIVCSDASCGYSEEYKPNEE
jgi:DNA topoisomerase-1